MLQLQAMITPRVRLAEITGALTLASTWLSASPAALPPATSTSCAPACSPCGSPTGSSCRTRTARSSTGSANSGSSAAPGTRTRCRNSWATRSRPARTASPSTRARPRPVFRWVATHAGAGVGGVESVYRVARAVAAGRRAASDSFRAGCEVGRMLTERLELPSPVATALGYAFERWDGRGSRRAPAARRSRRRCASSRSPRRSRSSRGWAATSSAAEMARRRAGSAYDPHVAAVVAGHAAGLLDGLAVPSAWDALLAAEPGARFRADRPDGGLPSRARRLRGPEVALHARPLAGGRRPRLAPPRSAWGWRRPRPRGSGRPRSYTTSAARRCRTRSGTSPGSCPTASASACGCTRITGAHPGPDRTRTGRAPRRDAPRAA